MPTLPDPAPPHSSHPLAFPRDDAGARAALTRRAWGEFLQRFAWAHFCTLTSEPTTYDRLAREYAHGFLRRLTRVAQQPVPWFFACEVGTGGVAHLHCLVSGTEALRTAQLEKAWRLGYTRVLRYDPSRGAAYYLTKTIAGECAHYDLSARLPRVLP